MRSFVLCLLVSIAAASSVAAQRVATWALPPSVDVLRHGTLLGHPTRLSNLGSAEAVPGVAQSDSLNSHDTRAEEGAVIGGLAGAVAGGVLFAHFTHRDGAVNSGTGTLGGAIVGAGLLGGMGALVGLLVGSAVSH
jgi:hypothetical protein